jgi:pyruvate,water dikinase
MTTRTLTALDLGSASTPEVLWLGEERASDSALTGGKVANLSRLAATFRVPPGFALTLAGTSLDSDARSLLTSAYRELAELTGVSDPPVAVRSSAVDEDGEHASFAGQHDTFLNVVGAEQLYWAVSRCLASFSSERAVDYRRSHGLPGAPERSAVLIQWLVPADAAGVVFSANPVTGERGEVVVNASWGLGESVVSGTVTPDSWVLDRDERLLLDRQIAEKRHMTIPIPGGTREVPVPGRVARLPALADDQARAAAELALALEDEMGWPADAEVAWSGSELFLLQCRPITTLSSALERTAA